MADPQHMPVIVGVGEVVDRPATLAEAREPLALMADAAAAADEDAGGGWLRAADSLDVINLVSWRYADVAALLSARLGIAPRRAVYGEVGGESPVRMLHDAALRIAAGESRVALICGGEAMHAAARARSEGAMPPWTPFAKDGPKGPSGRDMVDPLAAELGIMAPVSIYPFYDVAASAAWGETPSQARAAAGAEWARYAAVATTNPYAWLKRAFSAEEIITPSAENRLIAWPYTKLMVANPRVNQGAAVIVTSLAEARARGVADGRLTYIHGGAAANEPRDFLARDQFVESHAQNAVLEAATALAPGGFSALELYSCFPCVPRMARRALGIGEELAPTVTGGLTFFGAPLSSYMLHAACAMARRLRDAPGAGLVYGQGEFVTKHHALVLSAEAPGAPLAKRYSMQAQADARRGAVPELIAPTPGPATVESATVLYERDGGVRHGVVILCLPSGARTIAAVTDAASVGALTDPDRTPVGRVGVLAPAGARVEWRLA